MFSCCALVWLDAAASRTASELPLTLVPRQARTRSHPADCPASTITVARQKAPAKLYNMDEGRRGPSSRHQAETDGTRLRRRRRGRRRVRPCGTIGDVPAQPPKSARKPSPIGGSGGQLAGADDPSISGRTQGDTESSSQPAQEARSPQPPARQSRCGWRWKRKTRQRFCR